VSAATVGHTFGGAFEESFEDAHKMGVERQKPIFDLARTGYEALFKLTPENEQYVANRARTLRERAGDGTVVGMHVRHGDKHPFEFQYQDSYIPLQRFADTGKSMVAEQHNSTGSLSSSDDLTSKLLMVLASDDPEVYASPELHTAHRAQALIKLASSSALAASKNPNPQPTETAEDRRKAGKKGVVFRHFQAGPTGWEGGFFAPMFWSLGGGSSNGATVTAGPDTAKLLEEPRHEEAERLRGLVGRAYLLDLAVLGRATDGVVCTVSSMGCRWLAVMKGWESIGDGTWRNIDGQFEWRGVNW
jgi:hypothetical protein